VPSKAKKKTAARRSRVGDRVTFKYGTSRLTGTIVEDRGNIGVGGRRLYTIRFKLDRSLAESRTVELSAEDFRLRRPAA
jgi:hypothetical protein